MRNVFVIVILFCFACKTESRKLVEKEIIQSVEEFVSHTSNKEQETKYYQINNDNELELESSSLKIKTEDFHSENSYKYIVKEKHFSVLALFSYYDFGNYDQYVVTLDDSNNQISKELVSYNTAPDGNMEEYEYSNYRLDKKLGLEVFKVKIKEDLESNKIIKKDTIL